MKVLIVTTRYFGDCFLSAALARPIKEQSPFSTVDLLTCHGNEKILEGCRDIDHILTIDKKNDSLSIFKAFSFEEKLLRLGSHYPGQFSGDTGRFLACPQPGHV